jgi:hypothetical protein
MSLFLDALVKPMNARYTLPNHLIIFSKRSRLAGLTLYGYRT